MIQFVAAVRYYLAYLNEPGKRSYSVLEDGGHYDLRGTPIAYL